MISYEGLIQKLNERGLTRTALAEELGISSRTVAQIGHGEKIADRVLAKIAAFLGCKQEELCHAEISVNIHHSDFLTGFSNRDSLLANQLSGTNQYFPEHRNRQYRSITERRGNFFTESCDLA